MALTQAIFSDETEALIPTAGGVHGFDSVKLTPPLVLTISLMFIIASDGHVDASEISQIQSVIGQNDELVRFASAYVQSVPLKEFLSRAAQGLSHRDKVCILSNACDAMLADGKVHDIEQKTLHLLKLTFGISKKEFESHFDVLRLKNDRSVLGEFNLAAASSSMTPHLALAVSVLYMMSADGSIDKHEIGRLETLVAEFEGLQKLAVLYVKKTKRDRFIQEAAYALNQAQKNFILLNVYDTMSSDGVIAVNEDKIFSALLTAFGTSDTEFAPYVQVLEDKNLKSFDLTKVNIDHLFELIGDGDERLHAVNDASVSSSMGEVVSRTMQDNVAMVKQDLGASGNVVQIQTNAMAALNVQKLDAASDAAHRERLDDAASEANRVKINGAEEDQHRESIADDSQGPNRQTLSSEALGSHRESLTSDAITDHRESLASDASRSNIQALGTATVSDAHAHVSMEVRIDNLCEDIEALHNQLTTFENKNKKWLNIGKIFAQDEANKQKLLSDALSPNLQRLPPSPARVGAQATTQTLKLSSEASAQVLSPSSDRMSNGTISETFLSAQASTIQTRQAVSRRRGQGSFFHEGRVRDISSRRARMGWKEFVLLLTLTVCVSNLGAAKPEKPRGSYGVLQKLDKPQSHAPESTSVFLP
jgi:uncharacterized tellurite resistance protein B-like protein